ncbi:uncharacterized protein LOC142785125 isoform X3 [Rhipicephalus microplus]|uniref:uncharacterized protein LOC142785125 isoform X3 n=1 Tax=Rhipicephalus microplus TaxID=6941 RepID=UPI003F6C9D45
MIEEVRSSFIEEVMAIERLESWTKHMLTVKAQSIRVHTFFMAQYAINVFVNNTMAQARALTFQFRLPIQPPQECCSGSASHVQPLHANISEREDVSYTQNGHSDFRLSLQGDIFRKYQDLKKWKTAPRSSWPTRACAGGPT